jgi:hypothetical protein
MSQHYRQITGHRPENMGNGFPIVVPENPGWTSGRPLARLLHMGDGEGKQQEKESETEHTPARSWADLPSLAGKRMNQANGTV